MIARLKESGRERDIGEIQIENFKKRVQDRWEKRDTPCAWRRTQRETTTHNRELMLNTTVNPVPFSSIMLIPKLETLHTCFIL